MTEQRGPAHGDVGGESGGLGSEVGAAPLWDESVLDPQEVHGTLMTLATDDAARDVLRGEWLLKGLLSHVWEPFGFGSFFEYVERLFGYSPHQTSERIRVARALAELPAMRETLREGRLNWSVVREATRVVVPETEAEWLVALAGKTVREVERMVSGRGKGDGPNDPPDPRPERKVLRFEVNAETRALIAEARTQIVRDAGHHLSDDEVLQLRCARRGRPTWN